MPQQTIATQAPTFEPETIMRRQRLDRALADAQALDEFLVNPSEVAKRYGVSLTEPEITAIRNASHFFATWDFFCGEGKWVEAALSDGQAMRSVLEPSVPEVVAKRIQNRIAEEILRDIPEAIRRVVSGIGSYTLVEPDERVENLPEHIQPLARSLRNLGRKVSQELNREISAVTLHGLISRALPLGGIQPTPATPQAVPAGAPTDATSQFATALGLYLRDVVSRAVEQAVEQVRPGVTKPFARRAPQPRMEQPAL